MTTLGPKDYRNFKREMAKIIAPIQEDRQAIVMTKTDFKAMRIELREAKEKAIEENHVRLEKEMEKIIKQKEKQT